MNSLKDPKICQQLATLHALAEDDEGRWVERRQAQQAGDKSADEDSLIRLGDFYIPVSPSEGELLYMLARASKAQRIVEFGASYGISTLYLAAAARDNGGQLITTEIHPKKCAALRESFKVAGIDTEVTLLEGDAQQTLQSVSGPIDLLFLDGWKSLYLPIYNQMSSSLTTGSLIAADNITFAETKPYLDAVQAPNSGLITQLIGDMALSCVV